jgi:hypothetical protein
LQVDKVLAEELDRHRSTLDPANPRDLIDIYLKKIAETTDPNSAFFGATGEYNLREILFDLFFTSLDTTATTIRSELLLPRHIR